LNGPIPPHSIAVSPIGDFDPELIAGLCETVHRAFGIPARPHPILKDIPFAWNAERRQYHSTPVLEQLAANAPDWAVKVVALAKVDLYIPILTYVFGEAQLRGRSCIVSTHRLNAPLPPSLSPGSLFQSRLDKEVIHELGHTFNLRHCKDPACIMHHCRTESDVDRKSENLCRYCKVLLSDEYRHMERQQLIQRMSEKVSP
jgi:archaemetzincin